MRPRRPLLLLALLSALGLAAAAAEPPAAQPAFPRFVTSTEGERLDLQALVGQHTLVVVTLKATWCPVCRTQLQRLRLRLSELRACGVHFLVLAPGPRSKLEAVREQTAFPYPFVEDVDLAIARRLGLQLGPAEITPALFVLEPDLRVGWMQRGRSGRSYGDAALWRELRCDGWI